MERASQEQTAGGQLEGESQLLPLLQGLLQAPETDQTPDSGTESGEDQRSGLIAEVQGALEKLATSLRSDATDVTPERRSSLLQLVTKLQAGLASSGPPPERRNSSGRFSRRRQRHNRHTVGVSSEELADARRLIEEISLPSVNSSDSVQRLQKQKSESTISEGVPHSSSNSSFKSYLKSAVKNATAKPFSSSNSGNSSAVQTPTTDHSESLDLLFHEDDKRLAFRKLNSLDETRSRQQRFSQSFDATAVQQAATNKILTDRKSISESTQDSEDESSTVKAPQNNRVQPDFQPNPIYNPQKLSHEEKSNRFNTKKLRMKRANTIDIPKPLQFYEDDDDSDSYAEDENHRHSSYYALRGPITVHDTKVKSKVPTFEPKTESDKKFLAFINKQNEANPQKTSLWSQKTPVWGNKFGNIKNNFEPKQNSAMKFWKAADDSTVTNSFQTSNFGPKISRRSAKNLQQMFEERQKQNSHQKPNIWSPSQDQNIVKGSLKVNTKNLEQEKQNYKAIPQPIPVNKFSHAPQSAFKPLPKKDNLKPDSLEIIKTELKEQNGHDAVYLYSPKPLTTPQTDSSGSSPIGAKPWTATTGEHRVLNLAASKFENQAKQEQPNLVKPRKLSKDFQKVFSPQQPQPEKLPTYNTYTNGGSVRKLSGQYDSLSMVKPPDYSTHTTVKYIHPQPQTVNYQPPQQQSYVSNSYSQQYPNYSYQHPQPQQYQPSPQQYNPPPQQYQPSSQQYQPPPHQYQPPQQYQSSASQQHQPPPQQYQPQYQSLQQYQPQPQQYQPPQPQYQPNYQSPPQTYQPPQTQNYQATHSPVQYYQHVPGKESEQTQTYTSNYQFKPATAPQKVKEEPKKMTKEPPKPAVCPPALDRQISNESVHEYTAVSSKLMTGPVQQAAVTVTQKGPMTRDGHDMAAALGLKNTLQKKSEAKSPSNSFKYNSTSPSVTSSGSFKYKSPTNVSPQHLTSPSNSFKEVEVKKENKSCGIVKPMQQKPQNVVSTEVNSEGESVVTGQFQIPVLNVPKPTHAQVLSKSDSWNQICMQSQGSHDKPSPRASPKSATVVRSKSSHSLAVPKMFEAGMTKDEMMNKRKTMEAYLSGGTKSPQPQSQVTETPKTVKRSINRIKTSEKTSTFRQSSGLSRSRTLPDIACPDMLDESNVEKAFEDLFKSSS